MLQGLGAGLQVWRGPVEGLAGGCAVAAVGQVEFRAAVDDMAGEWSLSVGPLLRAMPEVTAGLQRCLHQVVLYWEVQGLG